MRSVLQPANRSDFNVLFIDMDYGGENDLRKVLDSRRPLKEGEVIGQLMIHCGMPPSYGTVIDCAVQRHIAVVPPQRRSDNGEEEEEAEDAREEGGGLR